MDALGRVIRTIVRTNVEEGVGRFTWDLRRDDSRPVAAGVYFCRLKTRSGAMLRKVVVQR
jgi:flagellar hook assembly protein FlgD